MFRVRTLSTGILLLALAACARAGSVQYNLTFNVTDANDRQQLALAAMRVIERRLESMGEEITDKEVTPSGDSYNLSVSVKDEEILAVLTDRLQEPIRFRIMEQVPEAEADAVVIGHGGFKETGINDDSLYSVEAQEDANGKGVIILNFTDAGRAKLAEVFKKNNGKYVGMFIRGVLASKLLVETGTLRDNIVIRDLPSAELARVFADDLNVGLHVTFTPAQ